MVASLYPELPGPVADELTKKLASLTIKEAFNERNTWHETATYAATGGNRVRPDKLLPLQEALEHLARQYGYPDLPGARQKRDFDTESGKFLYTKMQMTPSEASRPGVWNFISCILVPDIVRWRFPGANDITTHERFKGKNRALRNTFGRVWWRAYTLYQQEAERPFEFLEKLGEDELVQIMERTAIAASPVLAKQICRSLLSVNAANTGFSSPDLLRDAMKRLRRLSPLISFDALEEDVLKDLVNQIFRDAASSFSTRKVAAQPEVLHAP